jgi:hypothetical protein
MFPTLPVERKQEEALERIERNSIGAQPCKVTEEKSIVMRCETCGGESID